MPYKIHSPSLGGDICRFRPSSGLNPSDSSTSLLYTARAFNLVYLWLWSEHCYRVCLYDARAQIHRSCKQRVSYWQCNQQQWQTHSVWLGGRLRIHLESCRCKYAGHLLYTPQRLPCFVYLSSVSSVTVNHSIGVLSVTTESQNAVSAAVSVTAVAEKCLSQCMVWSDIECTSEQWISVFYAVQLMTSMYKTCGPLQARLRPAGYCNLVFFC